MDWEALACSGPRGLKESAVTERLDWTELMYWDINMITEIDIYLHWNAFMVICYKLSLM